MYHLFIKATFIFIILNINSITYAHDSQKSNNYRIINGLPAKTESHAWQVSIQDLGSHFCGGSIIAPQWILTARHCVIDYLDKNSFPRMNLVLGTHNLFDLGSAIIETPIQIVVHDNENADIALIKISNPVLTIPYLPLISSKDESTHIKPGLNSIVSGWGLTNENGIRTPNYLQTIQIPIIPVELCKISYGDELHDFEFCAGLIDGSKDACQGDSGGPIVVKTNSSYAQIGIISWGDGCGKPYMFGVYTKVANFYEWIKETIEK